MPPTEAIPERSVDAGLAAAIAQTARRRVAKSDVVKTMRAGDVRRPLSREFQNRMW
jgi:hypothetical protein